jgi:hypothetical protein
LEQVGPALDEKESAMRKIASIVAVTSVVLAGLLSPAIATTAEPARVAHRVIYRDVGFDAKDVLADPRVDIRRSTRTVFRVHGTRYLRVVVRGEAKYAQWDPPNLWVDVGLDTRGNTRWDKQLTFYTGDGGSLDSASCSLEGRGSGWAGGTLKFRDSGAMSCLIPMTKVHPRHQVHWRLTSYLSPNPWPVPHAPIDHAPDLGWFS